MKKIALIGVVLIMLIQSSIKSAIVFYYLYNKEYITAVFCENKEKPKMTCQGKCHLAKQIKKLDEKENTLPASLAKHVKETLLFCSSIIIRLPSSSICIRSITLPFYKLIFYSSPKASIFQPPQ
jgi:hypothetical protein